MTSSAILDLINMYVDSSMTIIYQKMVENLELRQIVVYMDFLWIFCVM